MLGIRNSSGREVILNNHLLFGSRLFCYFCFKTEVFLCFKLNLWRFRFGGFLLFRDFYLSGHHLLICKLRLVFIISFSHVVGFIEILLLRGCPLNLILGIASINLCFARGKRCGYRLKVAYATLSRMKVKRFVCLFYISSKSLTSIVGLELERLSIMLSESLPRL